MQFKLNAATRLIKAARADEAQAKSFIEQHLGVKVDDVAYSSNGLITYWVAKGQEVDTLVESISKATRAKAKKLPRHGSPDDTYEWRLADDRYIQLSTGFSWKLKQVVPSKIFLGEST